MMIKMQIRQSDMGKLSNRIAKMKALAPIMRTMLDRMGQELLMELRTNIYSQKYGDFGKPHSEKYRKWKQKHSAFPDDYWLHMGSVVEGITTWREGPNKLVVGFPPGAFGMTGRSTMLVVAQTLEKGSVKGHKSRPLFRLTFNEWRRSNLPKYLIEMQRAAKNAWRG